MLHVKAPVFAAQGKPWLLAKYNRGFSYLVILSFPIMAVLWFSKKRWLIIPFLFAAADPGQHDGIPLFRNLRLVLAVPVVVGAQIAPVVLRRLLAAGNGGMTVGWPFAARAIFPQSL